jgi:glycosyltransferase involved in cell wall biosynthesis
VSRPFDVTAVIPVRDGMPDVIEAVESVFAQTLPVAEIVVVDDASTDGSGDEVERRFGGRVRVIRGNWGSAAGARNAGLKTVRTEFVALLDADDLWFPDKLDVARQRFEAAPAADWFFSDGAFRTLEGQLHASWFALYADLVEPWCASPLEQLFEVNFVLTSSVVARRAALEAVGGFDERLTHAEDLDLWIRLSRRGLATGTRRALVRYQHREGGLTRQTESRLKSGAQLFTWLARDGALSTRLRRMAQKRASLYHYKLGMAYLREGRRAAALREIQSAWLFPERALPVVYAVGAAMLPEFAFRRLRSSRAAVATAAPLVAMPRVRLEGWAEGATIVKVPAVGTERT